MEKTPALHKAQTPALHKAQTDVTYRKYFEI